MKNKIIFVVLTAMLAILPIVSGCNEPAAPEVKSTPSATETQATVEPIELKFAHHVSTLHYFNVNIEKWAKEVEERTGGQVKITIYPSETLGKMFDEWDMVESGVSDIAWLINNLYEGVFNLSLVTELPFVMPSTRSLPVYDELFAKYISSEMTSVKVLWVGSTGPVQLFMREPVRTIEDLQGKQISAPPGLESAALQSLGATPVVISLSENYAGLERGLVDGMPTTKENIVSMQLYDLVQYHTQINLCNGISTVAMNLNTWNSLPEDVQAVLDELSPWAQQMLNDAADAADLEADTVFKDAGCEIIELSPEEQAKWLAATEPVVDEWIAGMEAKGLPGKEIVEEARRLTAGQ